MKKYLKLSLGVLLVLTGFGCSGSKDSTASTPSSTEGYITCPAEGSYVNNGVTTSCTPGSTVYVGTSSGYTTCPSTGYYVSNGITYSCTPGTSVYVNNGTSQYIACPATGQYLNNGAIYTCTPGTSVPVANSGYDSPGWDIASQCLLAGRQFGRRMIVVRRGGQFVCVPARPRRR